MKRIIIQEIKKKDQKYDTIGDYEDFPDALMISVSKEKGYIETEDELLGVAVHELVEMLLCIRRKIKIKDVTNWDLKHQDKDIEPGEIKGAPYFDEHKFANKIEKLFLNELKKHGKEKN